MMRKPTSRVVEYAASDTVSGIREAERRDIARDLHDGVAQPLSALVVSLECLQHTPLTSGMAEAYIGAWKELAREALDSLRSTLAGMHIHPHAQVGIPEALHRYLVPQARSRGLQLTVECRAWPDALPLDTTTSLYLLLREALTNVEKHAHASEVAVMLRGTARELSMLVVDNGVGFRPGRPPTSATLRRGHGLGLTSMRDRASLLGGQLAIASAPGSGTRIEIRVPRPRGA